MRILDINNNELQEKEINFNLGYLVPDKIYAEETPPRIPISYYSVDCFYFEDGTSLKIEDPADPHIIVIDRDKGIFDYKNLDGEDKVLRGVDICKVQEDDKIPEKYEEIQRYIPYTKEELIEQQKIRNEEEFLQTGIYKMNDILCLLEDVVLNMSEMLAGDARNKQQVSSLTCHMVENAILIRKSRGEKVKDILASYSKLSKKQKKKILKNLGLKK